MAPAEKSTSTQLTKSAGAIGVATGVSRILGLIRDTVIASSFTVFQTDCFFIAFTIPNVLRRLLGEGSINATVVPVYAEIKIKSTKDKVAEFLSSLWGTTAFFLGVTSVAGILLSNQIVSLYAWGFKSIPAKFDLTVNLNKFIFPYIFFVAVAAAGAGILNTHKKFFTPSLAPALWNVIMIASALTLPPILKSHSIDTIYALTAGVIVGGVAQLILILALLKKQNITIKPKFNPGNEGMKKIYKLMLPLMGGFGIYQIDILLSRLFASFLPQGSVSYLYYATRLIDFPQAAIFLALGTASLPFLATYAAKNQIDMLKKTYIENLSLAMFMSIPLALAFITMAPAIICIIFFRGSFTTQMFKPTWLAMAFMAPGIIATAGIRVSSPVFYALKDTKTPVITGAITLVIYILSCLLLINPLKHIGLAIALSISPACQLALLLMFMKKKLGKIGIEKRFLLTIFKILIASAISTSVVLACIKAGDWERGGNNIKNILIATGGGLLAISTYLLSCWLLKIKEIQKIKEILTERKTSRAQPSG